MKEFEFIPMYEEYVFDQELLLLETGEMVKAYPWKYAGLTKGIHTYKFKNIAKRNYECWFAPTGAPMAHAYEIIFNLEGVNSGDKADLTDDGDAIKVISTVLEIVSDFLTKDYYTQYLIATGSPTEKEKQDGTNPTKRSRVYDIMLRKNQKQIFGKRDVDIDFEKRISKIFITIS